MSEKKRNASHSYPEWHFHNTYFVTSPHLRNWNNEMDILHMEMTPKQFLAIGKSVNY